MKKRMMNPFLLVTLMFGIFTAPSVVYWVRDPSVLVANDGSMATFVHQKRKAATRSKGVGATTVYRAKDGSLRARTILLSRVPVSYDLPANSAQAQFFSLYF